ncbi:hypothetical protein BLA18112_05067 [Burkholderia lata]|uniref:Uncharacterized protein n=3 Tax=Burkholderia lata (strain ATCC 17760 / DSM 23089 / LMG 22485 / NCIMB 9086 / R18194 / 383) TaxID=482957 RepID=A0A833UEF1_BURL3|nr:MULTISPECIES: hypothetical protein [Burkholderia]ABB12581.1 hypothetical protein Bcep18194_B2470 [Burkholderia lata]KAF1038883.1 MAG: hypothetical protein GAK33_02219 [Burkholderia lata]MBN3773375.1 hypothetical protein [Burkholderia sp. Se-20378]MBN3798558.1 hypothetical protein [Burkholderia sp. Ac-20392]MBN3828246.1 hypothetical protein [Burkholderia sp. Ac-20384]
MPFICENVACRAVLARGQVRPHQEDSGWCFYCPDCKTRNELMYVDVAGGAVELVQPERASPPHKVVATARPLQDGKYAAQLSVQRALAVRGTYAAEEHWDELGVFGDAQEAVAHANSFATDLLQRAA